MKALFNKNEEKHQTEIREKCNPNNILKKDNVETKVEENGKANEVAMLEYKESIFKRFLNKIKKFFNR